MNPHIPKHKEPVPMISVILGAIFLVCWGLLGVVLLGAIQALLGKYIF